METVLLGNHVLELGAECLDGEPSNNPLYRLAEEYQLVEMDDSKCMQCFDHAIFHASITRLILL